MWWSVNLAVTELPRRYYNTTHWIWKSYVQQIQDTVRRWRRCLPSLLRQFRRLGIVICPLPHPISSFFASSLPHSNCLSLVARFWFIPSLFYHISLQAHLCLCVQLQAFVMLLWLTLNLWSRCCGDLLVLMIQRRMSFPCGFDCCATSCIARPQIPLSAKFSDEILIPRLLKGNNWRIFVRSPTSDDELCWCENEIISSSIWVVER